MSQTFDPKRVLRLVSNQLLQDLFESHQLELAIPWNELRETEVEPIFAAWQQLPEESRRKIEIVLREINDLAAGDEGTLAITEEAIRQGNQALVDDLASYESRHDKATWTYIRASDVWALAVRFVRADSLAQGRYWIKRCDVPNKTPQTASATLYELAELLSEFFSHTQGRGRHCQVQHYHRASGLDYFFAYLDDYADRYVTLDLEGGFVRQPERRAFELVFVYDREHGTLELYARGGRKVYVPLQEMFCKIILGEVIGPEDRDSHPYELNALIHRGFRFRTDPADGIISVRVRKLRLSRKGVPRSRITFESDPEGPVDAVYDMIDDHMQQEQLPATLFHVTQVGLTFTFDRQDDSRPESMSFEVSWPNSSNLKSRPDGVRELAEKYLVQWGLDLGQRHRHLDSPLGVEAVHDHV